MQELLIKYIVPSFCRTIILNEMASVNSENQRQSAADLADQQLVNNFEVPSWAGKPPPGLHLDVMKEGKLIQKLMIDEKKCFFFGRNRQLCDFPIEHASSSRVHAALVWHRALSRAFLIDLGSTHGTFIGDHTRLESFKPQQVPPDSKIHFGASQRIYIIKERPFTASITAAVKQSTTNTSSGNLKTTTNPSNQGPSSAADLPEDESELDVCYPLLLFIFLLYVEFITIFQNLTEYNTAHNRRIASLPITDQSKNSLKRQRKKLKSITFNEEEHVINPEDVDPQVGRFRNLCRTVVVPSKRPRPESSHQAQFFGPGASSRKEEEQEQQHKLQPEKTSNVMSVLQNPLYSSAAKMFNIPMPNLAPSLDEEVSKEKAPSSIVTTAPVHELPPEYYEEDIYDPTNVHGGIKRKKYAKEAWPGREPKPATGLLI